MKKLLLRSSAVLSALAVFPGKALAFCPLCAVAAGAGLAAARVFGVDDTISGVWAGGLIVALNQWSLGWLEKKDFRFPGYKTAATAMWWLAFLTPLYARGYIMSPLNSVWGMDKLLLGLLCGSLSFYLCAKWYESIKAANGGHGRYPFQKVALPVMPLVMLSMFFHACVKR
ncbi:MAG: hypothetical protein WC421_02020 [Elusimicrobiales bacterium]